MRFSIFMFSFAAMTIMAAGAVMAAASITTITDTVIKQQEQPDKKKVNFSEFDVNGDGQLSHAEVGEKLFSIFDTDGNMVIDNIEYKKPMVMTIIPMVKTETITFVFDGQTIPSKTEVTEEEFYKKSMLHKFTDSPEGLSANKFLDQGFWRLDDNSDKVIDLKEWKEAYTESLRPSAANPNRYNQ